ncbi:unnamed protein product [Diatraea saccharalis]|uniref:Ketosynthase family 3 (KS3) domain-containing protein n=1 Tax=Diatraea saccharalis TaxID=40085 RepID=A0A9N9R8H4_9NEOP|nr:unnamed protein product [Diatraea saccharalis]
MAPKPQEKVGENVGRLNKSGGEAVVISGISGQYPMSNNVKEFSDILYSKVNPITTENKRWKSNYPEVSQYVGTVPGLDRFDAQFFKVHYRLGSSMDTMSKKILEHTYQALYDAGINPHHLNGKKVAVFIGACFSETEKASFYASSARTGFGIMGCSKSMFANRISYWLNLKGPSMAIDEACCSSSAALTQAYQALTRGDCEAAIVGGANLILHPQTSIHTGRIIANCSDGKTKSFDDNADGCVKSEAIQVVFLQKAKDALRTYAEVVHIKNEYIQMNADHGFYRDPIVINKFLEKFYDEVRISPEVVEYVEAMGSAIPNADKAELEVISELFCKDRINPLLIGSVFSNIGYSEASSGLCSLIKDARRHRERAVPTRLRGHQQPLHHRVYRSHVGRWQDNTRYKSSIPHIVTISARHESAVQKIFEDLKSRPVDPEQLALFHNIHNTNISGHLARDTNSEQKTVTLTENCEYFDDARRPLWFVYSGMGSQWAGMGTQLMRIPIFAAAIYRCQRALEPKGIDLVHIITSTDKKIFDNILHSFVGIAAVQIGLTDVLRELGLFPNKIIGHSVGELGCAYADGCFTAEEMILSAYSRGLVSIQTPFIRGSMAAVGIGYQDIKDMLPPEIEVACHNSSESSTISGPADMMREFVASLSSKGIFVKDVPCSNIAYHSRYIAEAGPKLLKYLSEVIKAPKQRSDRWLSTSVSRDKWDEPAAQTSSAVYHTNNLLNPVLFEETSRLIPSNAVLVEIAPHGLLQAILKRSLPVSCKHIPLTRRGHPDNALMVLESIGKLFMEGYHPKVNVLYPKIEFPVSTETPMMSHLVEWAHNEKWPLPLYVAAHRKIAAAAKYVVCLHDPEHNYLSGHVIKGKTVYPFAAALVAVWDTVAMYTNKPKKELSVTFRDIQFFAQPVFNKNRPLMIHVAIHRGQGRFEVMEGDSKIATGYVNEGSICDINNTFEKVADKSIMFNSNDVYNILFEREYSYGGVFRNIYGVDDTLTEAKLLWNSNWVSLIDGMLQMNVLRQKHDAVSKPLGIRKMCIDIEQHNLAETDNLNRKIFLTANVDEILDKTRCGGITMENIKFCNLSHSNSEEVILRTPHFNNSSGSDDGKYSVPLEYKPLASPYVSLRSKSIGDLNSLTWVETKEAAASGIPVMIHYAGLNTVDSMTATGRYGTRMESDIEKISYKMDFSGITECGVQVMGVVPSGAASNRVMASPELLWPVPKHWTMEDAATVPLPYALAFYCLSFNILFLVPKKDKCLKCISFKNNPDGFTVEEKLPPKKKLKILKTVSSHTSMPVDSVHAVIERSVKNSIIYAPSQWATVFQLARKNPKPNNVEIMSHQDFKSWDSISEKYFKNNLVGKISKNRIVTFKK